jgi:arylsulfate sulfotransferase
MPSRGSQSLLCVAVAAIALILSACGDTSTGTEAATSDLRIAGQQPGVTPFISSVQIVGTSIALLSSITFTIAPKPTALSAPVKVQWTMTALANRGYHTAAVVSLPVVGGSGYVNTPGAINLPVFGLYSGYANTVTIQAQFQDGTVQTLPPYTITTAAYTDPHGIYDKPTIVKARAPGNALGYSYFMMKSLVAGPVIIDTDAEIRWAVPGSILAEASIFQNGQFMIGSLSSMETFDLRMDGTQNAPTIPMDPSRPPSLIEYTHNIDPGKVGLLAEFSGLDALGNSGDDIVSEITPYPDLDGQTTSVIVLHNWDMANIISDYMTSQGDNPALFVRPTADWFHLNAATYDPNDDTMIASSRENFVIKLDYSTGNIIWILGDPTKYWYTFPSLRAKALTLSAGGLYPVGQHGISITSEGYLMVFNDGAGSANQPTGEPAGISRTYSAVTAYSINTASMTAQQVWNFDYGQTIFASFCGSVYQTADTYLIDYATADNTLQARLVGLDANRDVVFDFQYASPTPCGTAWNAIQIPMESMLITD